VRSLPGHPPECARRGGGVAALWQHPCLLPTRARLTAGWLWPVAAAHQLGRSRWGRFCAGRCWSTLAVPRRLLTGAIRQRWRCGGKQTRWPAMQAHAARQMRPATRLMTIILSNGATLRMPTAAQRTKPFRATQVCAAAGNMGSRCPHARGLNAWFIPCAPLQDLYQHNAWTVRVDGMEVAAKQDAQVGLWASQAGDLISTLRRTSVGCGSGLLLSWRNATRLGLSRARTCCRSKMCSMTSILATVTMKPRRDLKTASQQQQQQQQHTNSSPPAARDQADACGRVACNHLLQPEAVSGRLAGSGCAARLRSKCTTAYKGRWPGCQRCRGQRWQAHAPACGGSCRQ